MKNKSEVIDEDYVQSANSLFHFMKLPQYLYDALIRKGLVPRYCKENIDYLNLSFEGEKIDKIAILQKCFCDIPLHKITANFNTQVASSADTEPPDNCKPRSLQGNNHLEYYGEYGIAFSKRWGLERDLQPVHYVNAKSDHIAQFAKLFESLLTEKDISDSIADYVINRLAYMKPLHGSMERAVGNQYFEFNKNFHDEKEWRYVPKLSILESVDLNSIIVKNAIQSELDNINFNIEKEKYQEIRMKFDYDDIKYLIVPDSNARIELIKRIMNLTIDKFKQSFSADDSKYILISKILVLSEIKKDW